jgi:polysaccharide pyruvyl transferase WcaK-like protein
MKPSLFATAATVRDLSEARAAALLIGGYDGSGNYGDIALVEAALGLFGRLGSDLVVLPVLERSRLEDHRALAGEEGWAARAIYFDPDGGPDDGLLPVGAPADLAFGAIYLYGGGYLNGSWGERKLAMLGAAEALLEAGGAERLCRLASGLQVEASWIEALGQDEAAALRAFDLLGVRDAASADALARLRLATQPLLSGDDAVAVLAECPVADVEPEAGERLRLNVHFVEHDWVSGDPDRVLDFFAGLVAELSRIGGRSLAVQPVIAYLDRYVDERPAVERLRAAATALGAEVAEPLVLRPATLAEAAPRLTEADLTLSCSFHVALTSLMLAVPAVLLGDNAYYAQKAAGLAEDFELPAAFTPAATADPVAAATEVAHRALGDAPALRRQIAAAAERQRRRRAAAETELLGRIASATLTASGMRIAALSERLTERSAEPAELRHRLAQLEDELEERRRRPDDSLLEAELRAEEAEAQAAAAHQALAAALGSRTWRMTAPLRRARAALGRR